MKGMERYVVVIGLLVVLFVALPVFAQITITNATELQNMNLDLAGDYVLGNDIDASSIPNFDPVGDFTTPFTGTFDGQGHTITGLTINRPGEDYVGLFGCASIAIIQNLHLVSTSVTGNDYVGGIMGSDFAGNTTNCSNAGSVTGNGYVGGIVGDGNIVTNCHNASSVTGHSEVGGIAGRGGSLTGCSNSGTIFGSDFFTGGVAGKIFDIQYCFNTGTISGNIVAGGIIGEGGIISYCYNTGAISGTESTGGVAGAGVVDVLTECYNTGDITGTRYVGGIVGSAMSHYIITNCYSTGAVSGTTNIGGLAGYLMSSGVVVQDCYSTGPVIGSGAGIGGLIGAYTGSNVQASYWNTETSGQTISADGEGKTTTEMTQQATYIGWDFSTIWGMPCDGSSYPYLLIFPPDPLMSPVNVTINQGVSQADPTDIALITFDVVFDVPVTDFDNGDLDFTGKHRFDSRCLCYQYRRQYALHCGSHPRHGRHNSSYHSCRCS